MQGRVGVNTDKPEEALTVNGNIQLTGQILQASDIRVKQDIRQVRTDSMSWIFLELLSAENEKSVKLEGWRSVGLGFYVFEVWS